MDVFHLILGFVVLFISGKYLVVGGVQLAKYFKIPTLVIGLTVVALGTSAPELLVSLKAAISGHPDISIGNVVGSNISNIALVLGITAIIFPIAITSKLIKSDWSVMMLTGVLFYILSINNILSRWEGVIFLILIVIFIIYSIRNGRRYYESTEDNSINIAWYWSLIIIIISSIGLVFGAEWLVKGATEIARDFNVSERVISVSIIAFGTSIPELATSVIAAIKKETDISIGNIIGSNIFNILAILGITSTVTPINVSQPIINFDMLWMLGISLLLLLLIIGKRKKLTRWGGVILLLSYISYIYTLLM
jgi:cation:H+ antiporter